MPTPFFQRLQLPPIHVAFEEIVPAASTAARVQQRAVYKDLIHRWPHFLTAAVRDRVESQLRPYRQRAWEGHLDTADFHALLHAFVAFKADFRRDMEAFDAYAMINCCAALLAQMLFVDNCFKEGLGGSSHPDNQHTVGRLVRHIQDNYQAHQVPIQESEAHFYAMYFLVQTLFDKIFVGDEEIVYRDPATGQVHLTSNYDFYTSYLELSNSKLITATDVEKELCYQLTTGWGDGIDVATWNALNQDYYSRSADNFFSAAYDEHLDKMLPQFPYARARAAHDIVAAWDGVRPVNLPRRLGAQQQRLRGARPAVAARGAGAKRRRRGGKRGFGTPIRRRSFPPVRPLQVHDLSSRGCVIRRYYTIIRLLEKLSALVPLPRAPGEDRCTACRAFGHVTGPARTVGGRAR